MVNASPRPPLSPCPLLPPVKSSRRNGKVANLPPEARLIVNQMLDAGETYKSIVAKLTELGHPGFFEQNIQRWKDNGYQRWIEFKEKQIEAQLEAELNAELAKDPKNVQRLIEANEIKLALKNSRLLDQIHDWDAETLLIKNPRAFFQLSRSVTQQLAERTRRERFEFEIGQRTKSAIRPVSSDTFKLLEARLKGRPITHSTPEGVPSPRGRGPGRMFLFTNCPDVVYWSSAIAARIGGISLGSPIQTRNPESKKHARFQS